MSQSERDAIDIFGLLYPMLLDYQKGTKAAHRASLIAEKYKSFSRDTSKLTSHDEVTAIVKQQLNAELALNGQDSDATQASLIEAYRHIVRVLSSDQFLSGFTLRDGRLVLPIAPIAKKKSAKRSPAKKRPSPAKSPKSDS